MQHNVYYQIIMDVDLDLTTSYTGGQFNIN